ncbi:hypothetical protein GCM10007415_09670 [Parapedobacter pyrenivorans]|uniref:Uncharacterized protein n=1 Tax=Parapedobacter pyrenivorans TaxID=1305674 RepID=A0A917HH97_9SPHI|nr:hypothetical protein [Parapedobacter pyrenivorans]GGG79521.1 hypothetical protein GCM10007415_09670 [Parapedobacter pyrenivorans]
MLRKLVSLSLLITLLCSWDKANDHYPNNRYPLKRKPYVELPLGAIKAKGWLLEMLKVFPLPAGNIANRSAGQLDILGGVPRQ